MPFAGYADFEDCVRKNKDKRDPQAYCAVIQRHTEGGEERRHVERRTGGYKPPRILNRRRHERRFR